MKFLSYITAFLVMAGSTCFGQGMRISAYPNTNNLGFSNLFIVAIKGSPGTNMNISWAQLSNLISTTVGGQFILENSGVGTNTAIYNSLTVTGSNTITGNLGVGTNIPWSRLHVVGDNNQYYTFIAETTNKQGLIVVNTNGITGIGTNLPKARLHVVGENDVDLFRVDSTNLHGLVVVTTNGSVVIPNTTNSTLGVIFKGLYPFIHDFNGLGSDGNNIFIGAAAGNFTMNTNGVDGGPCSELGSGNTVVGSQAFKSNTFGHFCVAIGALALEDHRSGSYNTAVGHGAQRHGNSGSFNTSVGGDSLNENVTGSNNVAIGVDSLQRNVNGAYNVSVGNNSLVQNTNGSYNTAVGYNSLHESIISTFNTAIGNRSLYYVLSNFNTAIGDRAGIEVTNGNYNTFIGTGAGGVAGQKSDALKSTAIGAGAFTTTNYQIVIGDTDNLETIIHGNSIKADAGDFVAAPTYGVRISDGNQAMVESGGNLYFGYKGDTFLRADEYGPILAANTGGIAIGSGYVGTAPPVAGLIVQSKTGIGTNAPAATLHVAGNNAQNVAQFGTTNKPEQVVISTNGVLSVNPGGGLNPVGCYGFLGMNDTNLIVCAGAAGVYTNVSGQDGFTTITTNGFFGNTAAIVAGLTNLYPGWYKITVCLSAVGANNQALEGEVFTNGVACDLIGFKKTYDAAARMDDMSMTGIIYLPANCGTQFMLQDAGTGGSVIVHRASLTVGTP